MPKTMAVPVLIVPKDLPRDKWEEWLSAMRTADPYSYSRKAFSVEECLEKHLWVEIASGTWRSGEFSVCPRLEVSGGSSTRR